MNKSSKKSNRKKPVRETVVGLIQLHARTNPMENFERSLKKISEVSSQGAQIVCLQELFETLYFPQEENPKNFLLAKAFPNPALKVLMKTARQKKIVIIAPFFEKRAAGIYHNTAAVIDADGTLLGIYRKMHIPDDPCFYEKYYFSPGDSGFKTFSTRYGKIGVLICWDQWFPEAARLTALQGAQLLFYPTAIGFHIGEKNSVIRKQMNAWETIQRAHAIANGVYVAAVNRVGIENRLNFWGSSFVADPFGQIKAKASDAQEETLIVSCPLEKINQIRHGWPFLRDRRIDSYHEITRRFIDSTQR